MSRKLIQNFQMSQLQYGQKNFKCIKNKFHELAFFGDDRQENQTFAFLIIFTCEYICCPDLYLFELKENYRKIVSSRTE